MYGLVLLYLCLRMNWVLIKIIPNSQQSGQQLNEGKWPKNKNLIKPTVVAERSKAT